VSANSTDFFALWLYNRGMETVYIDTLFILNLIIDYLLLLVSGRICSLPLRRWHILLGAAVGAGYSAAVVLPGCGALAAMPIKLAVSLVMVALSYPREGRFWRTAVVFLAVSAAFGGAVYAVSVFGGVVPSSGLLFPASMRVLLLSFGVCYCAISLVFRGSGTRAQRQLVQIHAVLLGRECCFTALRDTGNELCDSVSGKRVCVADEGAFFSLLPPEVGSVREYSAVELFERLSEVSALRGRVRLIPFASVGCSGALMVALSPDSVCVDGEERQILLALSPNRLCPTGEYNAII
jgi:stage II sporulation protein GA (sporulation sigma-E factor processing peptidase)